MLQLYKKSFIYEKQKKYLCNLILSHLGMNILKIVEKKL